MSKYGLALMSIGAAIILGTSSPDGMNVSGLLGGFIVIIIGVLLVSFKKKETKEINEDGN